MSAFLTQSLRVPVIDPTTITPPHHALLSSDFALAAQPIAHNVVMSGLTIVGSLMKKKKRWPIKFNFGTEKGALLKSNNLQRVAEIPVTVLAGFFGAAKTTLRNHLLTEKHGMRFAIIENG